jgi:hypothetical protein
MNDVTGSGLPPACPTPMGRGAIPMPFVVDDDRQPRHYFESAGCADEMRNAGFRREERRAGAPAIRHQNDLPTPSVRITRVGKHSSLLFSTQHDRTQVK